MYKICMAKLLPAEIKFCEHTARTAFANPFDEGYEKTYRSIRAACPGHMAAIERRGLGELRRFTGAQRAIMRTVFLFDVYLRFREALDESVCAQVAAGEAPIAIPCARELLALLARRGFPEEEALRVFAILFQIRRAHHFIVEGLIGRSACMREFRRHLWNNVFTCDLHQYEQGLWSRLEDFSTLLLGETGTGKGTAAAAIGRSGFIPFDPAKGRFVDSFTRSFVSINLSQFPETLIESELFGHRKGAFTGAVEAHEGVFARCSPHGAIFLDEIGEVSAPVQIKLLRVLQERVFSPVGSHEQGRFRGRIIAATNRTLAAARGPGGFRDDFFYRLSSDIITVPPLRQRLREDEDELESLLTHILTRDAGPAAATLQPIARAGLRPLLRGNYEWPGNVRELEQAVRRILLTRSYGAEPADSASSADRAAQLAAAIHAGTLDAASLLSRYCTLLYERSGNLEEVARRTQLDRRTVKRYLRQQANA